MNNSSKKLVRILCFAFIFGIFFSLKSTYSIQAKRNVQTPNMSDINVDFDAIPGVNDSLREPILNILREHQETLPKTNAFIVTAIRFDDRDEWVYVTVVPDYIITAGWEGNFSSTDILEILIKIEGDSFIPTLRGTLEFDNLLRSAPDDFISHSKINSTSQPSGTDYKFPWTSGQGWRRGALSWHTGYGPNSLDFLPNNTTNPSINFAVLAAEAGRVSKDCDDGKQALIRIDHSNGQTKYLHLDAGSVVNSLVGHDAVRGQFLGLLYEGSDRSHGNCQGLSGCKFDTTCGYGTATHLHFGVSDRNMTVDGNNLNDIANRGQQTYTSTNQRVDGNNTTTSCTESDGVILYEHSNYTGRCSRFTGNDNNLSDDNIGNDAASSIRIRGNYEAILYENSDFGGSSTQFTGDDPDFGNDGIGHDRASSIKVQRRDAAGNSNCDGGQGIYLYENSNYGGRCSKFTGDTSSPDGWYLGNDAASSIRIIGSYDATLYEHSNYQGASSSFSGDDPDLSNDAIGNDRVSSLRVRTRTSGNSNCDNSNGVQLYEHANYQGKCSKFTTDSSSPNGWYIGNDAASSIRIFGNYEATVYQHDNYNGTSTTYRSDDSDFGNDAIGHDQVSSIRVRTPSSSSSGPTTCSDNQFLAEYYANQNLSGSPSFRQCVSSINNDWRSGGPGGGISSDHFSIRWTGRMDFDSDAVYRFTARTDDGVKVWVDNQIIINQWRDMAATNNDGDINLHAGLHLIKMEYFENAGEAVAQLSWRIYQQSSSSNDDGRTIGYGDGLNGEINPAGDRDDYYFTGSTGASITLRMDKRDSNLDSYIELYGPDGRLVGQDDDSGGDRNSRLAISLPQNGRYKVIARGYSSTQTGGYRLDLSQESTADPDDGRWISLGSSLTGTISPNNDRDNYFVSGTVDRVIVIRMNKVDSGLDSYLELYSPTGSLLATNDDGGGDRNSMLAYQLTQSGTYRIVARSWNLASSGHYNLTVNSATNTTGNLALNKSATADSTEFAGVEPYKAFDGNLQTRWSSRFSDPQFIYVNLGSSKTFNQVVLKWEAAYARSYGIYAWTGTNWKCLYYTLSGDGGTDTINFSPVTAQFVGMFGTSRATNYGYSLWEFEVYNSANVLIPLIPPDPNDKGEETDVQPLIPLGPNDPDKDMVVLLGEGETSQENTPLAATSEYTPTLSAPESVVGGAPTAFILYPLSDQYFNGQDILFQAIGTDNDENGSSIVAYEWISDKEGLISTEAIFTRSVQSFSEGNHTISLRVQDNEGVWSQPETVAIDVVHQWLLNIPLIFSILR